MFAGPNGSGKSTLKSYLSAALIGVYLNPDEIEQEIRQTGFLDLKNLGVEANPADLIVFLKSAGLLHKTGLSSEIELLQVAESRIGFGTVEVNAYWASVLADFIRSRLLEQRLSFTLETVMSHGSKIELLRLARDLGYRTYLYYVATDDPSINVSRVRNRVKLGGHPVPEEKILERYDRSLGFLLEAIQMSNRAYIFDNSGENADGTQTWLAEITDGKRLELKSKWIPAWFKHAVLDRVG